jgi:HPt (histidine-containing phosphotransfer) domain-containing protein
VNNDAGIDPQGLVRLNRIGGPDFVRQMIELFFKEAPERLSAARNGEKAGDLNTVTEATHALKSSARNFGANRLASLAEKIELMTRANSCENLSGLVADLDQAYAAAKTWLEHERDSLK